MLTRSHAHTHMHAVIVANGELHANARLKEIWQRADWRLAADGGARNAREQLGRAPQVVVGDLDSLDGATRAWLEANRAEFIQHPVAKDETDLELALNLAATRGAARITLLGAVGGRADQFIANVLLLTRTPNLVIAGATSELWAATGHAAIEGNAGDTVSLIPIDARVEGIVTRELEYPLRDEDLERGTTRGVSNRMLADRAEVSWRKGLLLIVHLLDGGRAPVLEQMRASVVEAIQRRTIQNLKSQISN
jgi:thiamine pyrophosphokinase